MSTTERKLEILENHLAFLTVEEVQATLAQAHHAIAAIAIAFDLPLLTVHYAYKEKAV
jgi:hypothetical protein